MTEHGGQSRLLLSVTHAAVTQIKALVANVRAGLEHIRATAPLLPSALRWQQLVRYIVDKIIAANAQNTKKLTPCLLCSLLIAGSAIIAPKKSSAQMNLCHFIRQPDVTKSIF